MKYLTSLLLLLVLVGCDKNEVDIEIKRSTQYIDLTEQVKVNSYNGYMGTEIKKMYDEQSDTYTITLEFKKVD